MLRLRLTLLQQLPLLFLILCRSPLGKATLRTWVLWTSPSFIVAAAGKILHVNAALPGEPPRPACGSIAKSWRILESAGSACVSCRPPSCIEVTLRTDRFLSGPIASFTARRSHACLLAFSFAFLRLLHLASFAHLAAGPARQGTPFRLFLALCQKYLLSLSTPLGLQLRCLTGKKRFCFPALIFDRSRGLCGAHAALQLLAW